MGIPLLIIAAILFMAAYRGSLPDLAKHAAEDIGGAFHWIVAMAVIGAIGLVPKMRPISNALFFLVIIVLFLANKSIFDNMASGAAFKPEHPAPGVPAPIPGDAPPKAAPGTSQSGTLDQPPADANAGIMSNVVPFPNLKFGGFDLGSILPDLGKGGSATPGIQSGAGQQTTKDGLPYLTIGKVPTQ